MSDTRRMVSCISGDINHLYYVVPGSAADAACKGQHISTAQCPDCVEERRAQLRRESRMCACNYSSDVEDAELCQDGCVYRKEARDLPEAPEGLNMYIPVPND